MPPLFDKWWTRNEKRIKGTNNWNPSPLRNYTSVPDRSNDWLLKDFRFCDCSNITGIVLLFAAWPEQVCVFRLAYCNYVSADISLNDQSEARTGPGDQSEARQGGTLNCSLESVPCSAAFRACSQLRHAPTPGLSLVTGPRYWPLTGRHPDTDGHHDITIWTRGMSAGIILKFSRWNENRERLR